MNVLLTGALGHLGSYLLRHAPSHWNITGCDDLSTQRICSLFNLPQKIKFYDKGFETLTKKDLYDIDYVIHLAAITDAVNANAEQIQKINVDYTKRFIDICADEVAVFVFPSSTSVYGTSQSIVCENDISALNPQSKYAESKLKIEEYLRTHPSLMNTIILRLGTICGTSPGMRFHTAINSFCYNAVFHNKLKIWKQNYEMLRPYLTLNDFCRALRHLSEEIDVIDETYNLVTDNIKLSNIVGFLQNQFENPLELEFVDTPLLNQYSYIVSADKFKQTGFYFMDNVYQCIKDTLKLLNGNPQR